MGLKQQAIKGIAWTSVGTIGYGGLNLVVTIVLARLLSPNDFGIIELLVVFSSISDIIVDSGFSQALIRDGKASDKDLSSVFFLNIGVALVIYGLLFFASPSITRFYDTPILLNLSRFVFLTILFNSMSVIQNANLSRNLNFRPYAIASVAGVIVAGSTAVCLAHIGWGVWALAVNLVLFSFIRMSMLWILGGWRPSFVFCLDSVKRYLPFGINLMLQGLADKVVTNLESLIIGKIYLKSDLGHFSQGRKLDSYVVQTSTSVIQKVTYPLLSKINTDENRLKDGYRKVLGITMMFIVLMVVIMFCGAEHIMAGVFGKQWLPAAEYLKLWSLCGFCVAFYSVFINIFLVRGRSALLLRCSLAKQSLRIVAIALLARVGIRQMMYGIVAVSFLSAFIYSCLGGRLIGYRFIEIARDLMPFVTGGSLAGVAAIFITPLICTSTGIVALAVMCSIISVAYLLALFAMREKALLEIMRMIRLK